MQRANLNASRLSLRESTCFRRAIADDRAPMSPPAASESKLVGSLLFFISIAIALNAFAMERPARADEAVPGPPDRFAEEPERPKAQAPVQFIKSWEQAKADAKQSGRRILAVFTGDFCGWCRVLEKRTLTDAEVVSLSKRFVCVELNTGDEANARIVDKYAIETIPRTLVLTADGDLIDKRTGYIPATEYAAWLREAESKPPGSVKPASPSPIAPRPVGASESEADLVIWWVDSSRSMSRWGDADWIGHFQLLRLLRAAGLHPRIEHISRESFAARWDQADAAGRAPNLITADQFAGFVRDLEHNGRINDVFSVRLAATPENASCADFAGRFLFLVPGGTHESAGRRAIDEILKPGPAVELPGARLGDSAGRADAIETARRAVVAYMSGNPEALKRVVSPASPQLSRCTKPHAFLEARDVTTEAVEIRGNKAIAFARVEARFRGKRNVGADAILVILRREGMDWKALVVTDDIVSLKELPVLCSLALRPEIEPGDLPTPRLLYPADGQRIGIDGKSFAWESSEGTEPLTAQVCQVLLDEGKDQGWPSTRLKVYPGPARGRALLRAETDRGLTGATAPKMFWCVWNIARDGRIAPSDVRKFLPPDFKF